MIKTKRIAGILVNPFRDCFEIKIDRFVFKDTSKPFVETRYYRYSYYGNKVYKANKRVIKILELLNIKIIKERRLDGIYNIGLRNN